MSKAAKAAIDSWMDLLAQKDAEIARLRAVIARIDAINDNPADFNSDIDRECDRVLRPHLVPAKS